MLRTLKMFLGGCVASCVVMSVPVLAGEYGCTKIVTTKQGEMRTGCGHAVSAHDPTAAGAICVAKANVQVNGKAGEDCCKHPAGTVTKIEITPIGRPNEKTLVACS